ncbi:uroporphyrinogen decarboxylase family protein [Lachnoclostridium phocaeense]|uniref:uroporphyrinogen decarboxylase family protein n=1 Tax=Lachnoclostridium phocaeense TaxID=1871021 RepID=UPI00248DA99C|nr:uroporphyrinogen decarboxylase family protein [Lachnoclostridium phocaeense]
MNSKERVYAAIQGKEVDKIPAGFSLHFPSGCKSGEKAVEAHLDFFKETDVDICKIMNENLVPDCDGIVCGQDWEKIPSFDMKSPFMVKQIEMTKRILEKGDPDKFYIGTLHGTVASGLHPIEKRYGYDGSRLVMVEHLRQNPEVVWDALKRITEGMCMLAEKYIELGLNGVYYAALGGEYRYYTDEEFAKYIEPLDKQILSTIQGTKGISFLHICKDRLNMERYRSYRTYADVVNWGVYEAPFELEEGKNMFPGKTIMGGLANRKGVLVEGSIDDIKNCVKKLIRRFGRERFILGADCTLPTDISYQRIAAAIEAAREC